MTHLTVNSPILKSLLTRIYFPTKSWKCNLHYSQSSRENIYDLTQRHISTSLLIENTFPQALTIDELRKTSLLQFLISQRITDIKILCIITIKLIRLLVFFSTGNNDLIVPCVCKRLGRNGKSTRPCYFGLRCYWR